MNKWFEAIREVLGVGRKTREEQILADLVSEVIYDHPDYTDNEIVLAVCELFEKKYR